MIFVLATLAAVLILDVAVLAALKVGLNGDGTAGDWTGRQPC